VLLAAALARPATPLGELPLMDPAQQAQAQALCPPAGAAPRVARVHHQVAEQAQRQPDAPAVSHGAHTLSYGDLDRRANRLARHLAHLGVGPDVLVGLALPRGVDLLVALLAVHKAGGAYVPLDPAYPPERIAYMVQDSKAPLVLALASQRGQLPPLAAPIVAVDEALPAGLPDTPFDGGAQPHHLAYVIYTSGSTGQPKGVMVEHRNVVNFFAGMDAHLGGDGPGTWLAVTSLSFDISVLELCWTLARGWHVVVAPEAERAASGPARGAHAARPLDFSLFYFSADESERGHDKYRLLLEGARYADQHGFAAVWTPERHFNAFGGLYPNPAVTGAAVAAITQRVQVRAGSVVLPLHHPLRVAEEWSVVDNLSNGRVGISVASGWHPNDFVLRPQSFANAKQVMVDGVDTLRRLWRGEELPFDGPLGKPVPVRVLPRPVQAELPLWVTSAGNPETFAAAGRLGANVLTHLLGQTVEELGPKLAAYRQARREAGHAGEGIVSLMLHTFVGPDEAEVRATVRAPMVQYLRSSMNLVKQYAWSFPAFKRREGMNASLDALDLSTLTPEESDALLDHAFERYYESSGLFGTPAGCLALVDRLKAIGVDDLACLVDFGVPSDTVLAHLPYLNQLRQASVPAPAADADTPATLMQRHAVTHLQCTPSLARMLLSDSAALPGLARLKRVMIGGEAFPPTLARDLLALVPGTVMNMYGPTETTIWSAVHPLPRDQAGAVPLGRPLANQQLLVLDSRQQPLPPGVPGELVIAGAGVVRGYLHREALTAERFVTLPATGGQPARRAYRTGDLVRLADHGELQFLGRLDHQVKLRGYRIELGEIEAALLAHPSVREAVVVAREDTPGDVRLAGYVTPQPGAERPADAPLREHLRQRLPDYMVPSHLLVLPALPQTPNGKVDRKALPAPAQLQPAAPAQAYLAPASALEQQVAEVWREVLKLPQVGMRDNFFDLGGHSLLAVQAHRLLRDRLQQPLSITDLFRFPTIASLVAYLGQADAPAAAQKGSDRAAARRAVMQRRPVRPQ
jgi:natural product biosynthesis luciferase-like monooxygenase protein